MLKHLNAIPISESSSRISGCRQQKPGGLLIYTPALEVKCDLGSQLSLAGAVHGLQPLSYCAMKSGPFSGCNTPINGLTVQRMPELIVRRCEGVRELLNPRSLDHLLTSRKLVAQILNVISLLVHRGGDHPG